MGIIKIADNNESNAPEKKYGKTSQQIDLSQNKSYGKEPKKMGHYTHTNGKPQVPRAIRVAPKEELHSMWDTKKKTLWFQSKSYLCRGWNVRKVVMMNQCNSYLCRGMNV